MIALLYAFFLAGMIAPVIILFHDGLQLRWRTRYLVASIPLAYFVLGWLLMAYGFDIFGCGGHAKGPQGCTLAGFDVTWLIEFGGGLLFGALFELPISLCLLSVTALSQLGAWHLRVKREETEKARK